jgi:RNA polymerase sigma-70 factor (ECF subfamily)
LKGTTAVPLDFDALVGAHSAELYAYLWRLLRDPAEAEDGLQETFLRAFRAYGRARDHANPRAWLYRIATNTARTRQRRRAREAARTTALEPELAAAPGAGPAEQAARNETLAAVARAVDALPAQQRAALILRKYQELSYAEVAASLQCTEAAARANVYQALKKVRGSMRRETKGILNDIQDFSG